MNELETLARIGGVAAAVVAITYYVLRPLVLTGTDWFRARYLGRVERDRDGNPITLATVHDKVALLGSNHLTHVEAALHDLRDELAKTRESMASEFNKQAVTLALIAERLDRKR